MVLKSEAEIADAFVVDFVQQVPFILDILCLFVAQNKVLVNDLDSILLLAVLVASQNDLSKTSITKPSDKFKVCQGESYPAPQAVQRSECCKLCLGQVQDTVYTWEH